MKDMISQCRRAFESKPESDRQRLIAESRSFRHLSFGTIASTCPACTLRGVLTGRPVRESEPIYVAGDLFVEIEFLANDFVCPGCDLHLTSVAQVGLAGMQLKYKVKKETSLHLGFQPEWPDEYENM